MAIAYWVEADEEAGLLVPDWRHSGKRRALVAYALLGVGPITHPADIFQSSDSHDLFFDPLAQPLLQKIVRLHLGDSASVDDYMTDRVEKLSRDRASSRHGSYELNQYRRYGKSLREKSSQLDDLFGAAIFLGSGSRDLRFRQLIRKDLANDMPFGPNLSCWIRQGLDRSTADTMLKFLDDLMMNRGRFIGIDGIISRLVDSRCSPSALNRIHHRLLVLHWEARADGEVEIPFLSRALGDKPNPLDPHVFWVGVEGVLGSGLERDLMNLPWSSTLRLVEELRNDGVWGKFIETYHATVAVVAEEQEGIVESMVQSGLRKKHPRFVKILLTTRPDVTSMLSWTFHLLSWFSGVPGGWGLVWKVGSALTSAKKVFDHLGKIANVFYTSDRHLLDARIRRMLTDAKGIR